ncbi:hypothetical protein A7U60_g9099 [Sanghuangporus baumii]|uniref:Uncharacterized protein n=1 Tax=Sanghuangporus baumii TaxID=108892 RepID=A0A9Q5HQ21_SANBA|nr:hypothetical protein A7U60_g9099 [Sanghuangporus baumii]
MRHYRKTTQRNHVIRSLVVSIASNRQLLSEDSMDPIFGVLELIKFIFDHLNKPALISCAFSLDLDDELSTLSASIFYEIALKRLSPVLLPNLSRLKIMVDEDNLDILSHSLLFMDKNIEEFALDLPYPDSDLFQERIPGFFEDCAILDWPIATIENHVALFLSSLPKLVSFRCSVQFTTPCIASALSRLPSLRSIEFKTEGDIGSGLQSDVMVFEPLIAFADAFHALSVFEVSATFDDMHKLLEKDFALGLDKLFILSPQLESAESLRQCLCALPKQRPWLRSLHLDSVNEADKPLMNDYGQEIDCVALETL